MAFEKYGHGDMQYIVDSRADLADLPLCGMGSTCYVIDEAAKYICNSKGEWISQVAPVVTEKEEVKVEDNSEELKANIEALEKEIADLKETARIEKLNNVKYEVTNLPEGSFVDYREKEIRIYIPEDAEWQFQNVGENGNPNMYHFTFKAYAPEGAHYFKEDDLAAIEDQTLYTFDGPAAGIDKDGRKYSIGWMAAAVNSNGAWTYFGKNSTKQHMIGFYYTVEWYDENEKLIGMDAIRISLANKDCFSMIEPFYIGELGLLK